MTQRCFRDEEVKLTRSHVKRLCQNHSRRGGGGGNFSFRSLCLVVNETMSNFYISNSYNE